MKHKSFIFFAALLFISLTASKCRKDKTPADPLDQLPPETQTGAGTIGFLANGQPIIANYPKVYATYIYTTQDGYSLGINAKGITGNSKWFLTIITDSLKVKEDNIYLLNNEIQSKQAASADFVKNKFFLTKRYLQGELYISHFDSIKQIMSGTFWFDAADTVTNDLVHITDGMFDLHYTR